MASQAMRISAIRSGSTKRGIMMTINTLVAAQYTAAAFSIGRSLKAIFP